MLLYLIVQNKCWYYLRLFEELHCKHKKRNLPPTMVLRLHLDLRLSPCQARDILKSINTVVACNFLFIFSFVTFFLTVFPFLSSFPNFFFTIPSIPFALFFFLFFLSTFCFVSHVVFLSPFNLSLFFNCLTSQSFVEVQIWTYAEGWRKATR